MENKSLIKTIKTIKNRKILICLPKDYYESDNFYPVLYLQDGENIKTILRHIDIDLEYIIVGIYSENRLNEYTPWKEKALNEHFEDFGGEGDKYIKEILEVVKERIDLDFRTKPEHQYTALGGYSLGGLISIYTSFISDKFGVIIGISSSLWFPEFLDYVEANSLINNDTIFFISHGKKEGKYSSDIKKNTLTASPKIFESLNLKVSHENNCYSLDEGRHHENKVARYKSALKWLDNIFKSVTKS